MVINYKVSRDFLKYSDAEADEFAVRIVNGLTGNAAFPTPPVIPANLAALGDAFRTAIAAATGDPVDTVAKDNARDTLMTALRKDANYVEMEASQDLQKLLSSGYYAAGTNRAQTPLDTPTITEISNLATTQLLVRLTPIDNAKSYQVQTSINGSGTWQEAGIFTQARRIVLPNLTPGTICNVRARAIGGSTGASDWSLPAARMVT